MLYGAEFEQLPPLLIFDGECIMCNRFIVLLAKSLPSDQRFDFAYSNGRAAESRLHLADISIDRDALVLLEEHNATTGAQAVFAAFSYAKAPWKYLSLLTQLPSLLTESIYDLVARNRKRIGQQDSCPLPSATLAARLVK